VAYRSGNSLNSSGSTGTVSVPVPTGFAAGDIIIGAVADDAAGAGSNAYLPAAFTALPSSPVAPTNDGQHFCCGTKYESGTPPTSYTYSFAAGGGGDSCIVQACFSGTGGTIDSSTGMDAANTFENTTINIPASGGISLTPSVTNDLVFIGGTDPVGDAVSSTWTPPSGMTTKVTVEGSSRFTNLALFVHENNASGSTGALTAVDTQGSSLSSGWGCFLIAFAATAAAPTIVQHPASTTINDGEYWYGWVLSNNPGTDTYQWQQNTGSGWSNVVGQTGAYFTAGTRLHVADSGIQYRCNVTNGGGTTASNAATITVQTPRSAKKGQWDPSLVIKAWW
jgi:hypothetical protein